jgi:hypothetical protein
MEFSSSIDNCFPRLKAGVRVIDDSKAGHGAFVGTALGGIFLVDSALNPVIRAMDGTSTILTLAQNGLVDLTKVRAAMRQLQAANLVTLLSNVSPVPNLNQTLLHLHERMGPEENLTQWRAGRSGDESTTIWARKEFAILIFGTSRVAMTLLSLLQASGFSQTKVISGSPASPISPREICGLSIRLSEIGMARGEAESQISRYGALFAPMSKTFPIIPSLIISTNIVQPDYIQRWMSESVPHLQISGAYESMVDIGPLVVPGSGPCLRCVAMTKYGSDQLRAQLEIAATLERPPELAAGAVAHLCGLVTLFVCEFADTKSSGLIGKSIRIDLLNPGNPEHSYWQPHPFCGCLEVI